METLAQNSSNLFVWFLGESAQARPGYTRGLHSSFCSTSISVCLFSSMQVNNFVVFEDFFFNRAGRCSPLVLFFLFLSGAFVHSEPSTGWGRSLTCPPRLALQFTFLLLLYCHANGPVLVLEGAVTSIWHASAFFIFVHPFSF